MFGSTTKPPRSLGLVMTAAAGMKCFCVAHSASVRRNACASLVFSERKEQTTRSATVFFVCDFDSSDTAASESSSLQDLEVKVAKGRGQDRSQRRTRPEGRRTRLAGELD